MDEAKKWTGERLETFVYNENTNEHLHRYAIAMQLVAGKRVLDIACGEGYGSNLMASVASSVTGVDIDMDTVEKAAEKYDRQQLFFLQGSASSIPCANQSFDVVVSFETIEHHDKHHEMMAEIKRVLAPGGLLLISSPDKLYYSDTTGYKNPYHVKELYRTEFEGLINQYFSHASFFGQRSFYGSLIAPFGSTATAQEPGVYTASYTSVKHTTMQAVYILALAGNGPLPHVNTSILNGAEVLEHKFEAYRIEVTKDAVAVITKEIRSSWSFRIGHFILAPVRLIKRLFHA